MLGWWGGGWPSPHVLRFAERKAWRSPAYPRQSQRICVKFRLFHLIPTTLGSPNWVRSWQSGWGCSNVPPVRGAAMTVNAFDFEPRGGVAYHAEFSLLWKVGGRRIASASYTYDRPRDYSCQTANCWADYGYQNVAYMQIGGGF